MRRRITIITVTCLSSLSSAAIAGTRKLIEHGDFSNIGIDYPLPHWWWAVPLGAVILVIAPVVFWKHRRAYLAAVSLALAILAVFAWKRSYRGEEGLSQLDWRDSADGAIYEDMRGVSSSAGGIGLSYCVIRYHFPRRGSTPAVTAAEFAEGPNPRLVFGRGDLLSYPSFGPERSFGLFPYQGTYKHGVNTLAVQFWRKPLLPDTRFGTVVFDGVAAPYWLLLVVLSIQPFWWACRTWRMRRRRATNRCLHCGYDLRASEGLCPECGTAIPAKGDPGLESSASPRSEGIHPLVSD